MPPTESNRMLLLGLFDVLISDEYANEFSDDVVAYRQFLRWFHSSYHSAARKICEHLRTKGERRQGTAPRSVFDPNLEGNDLVLVELGTEPVRQMFRAANAVEKFARMSPVLGEIFSLVMGGSSHCARATMTLLTGAQFVQLVLDRRRRKVRPQPAGPSKRFAIVDILTTPSIFEVCILYHCFVKVDKALDHRILHCRRNQHSGTRIGLVVQLAVKAWNSLIRSFGLGSLSEVVQPYAFFSHKTMTFNPLRRRQDGFARKSQNQPLRHQTQPTFIRDETDQDALDCGVELDGALRQLTASLFDYIDKLILNNSLYELSEDVLFEWNPLKLLFAPKALPSTLPHAASGNENEPLLPPCFQTDDDVVPDNVFKVLRSLNTDHGKEIDTASKGTVVHIDERQTRRLFLRLRLRPRLTTANEGNVGEIRSSDLNRKQMDDTECMKRRQFSDASSSLNAEEYVPPERYGALSKETKELMDGLLHPMSKVCTVLECDFRDAVAEAALNAGVSLSAAVDLILTDPPYNSRRLAGKSNSEHDTLLGNDMQDAVEVISEVMAPGGHGILFTATRMFADWCQYLECCPDSTENHSQGMERDVSSEEVDDDTERGEVDDESGTDEIKPAAPLTSTDKKRKRPTSTGSEPMFDVERVPLRFTRARGVYNQDPRVARLHHANVTDEAVHFWRRGLPWNNMRAKVDYFITKLFWRHYQVFQDFALTQQILPESRRKKSST